MSVRENHELACPVCNDDTGLTVTFTGQARLYSDGTDDCGDHEWDDASAITCDCGHGGVVAAFRA